MRDAGVIHSPDTVSLRLVVFDDRGVSTDMVGVAVRSDQVIDSVDVVCLQILDHAAAVLPPIARIDHDRLTVWRPDECGVSLPDVNVVNLEFSINIRECVLTVC